MKTIFIIGLVLLLVVSSGCINDVNEEKASPETAAPEATVAPDKSTERQEEPDPHVRFGTLREGLEARLSTTYHYSSGILIGATVHVVVENRGGAGPVEVIFKVENEEMTKEFVYLESGEEKELTTTVPLTKYRYRHEWEVKITVTASPAQLDINSLIRDLKQEDPEIRENAAVILGGIREEKAVEPLIQALKDEDGGVRWRAAEALGKIGNARAVEPLIQALKDEDGGVRSEAAEALGKIGDARAVEPLAQALDDKLIRFSAVKALGNIGVPAVDILIHILLNHEEWEMRKEAAVLLGAIKHEKAVAPLVQALNDEHTYVQSSAARALGKIGNARAVEPLIQALKDEIGGVRSGAARALGEIGDVRAVEPLIQALKDGGRYVRSEAAEALGKIEDARAVAPLVQALNDEHTYVQSSAARALVKIGEPAVEPLIQALRDEIGGVQWRAARALGEIGDVRAVEPLTKVAEDKFEEDNVREAAREALQKIKG